MAFETFRPHWYNGGLSNSPTLEIAPDDVALLYGATLFTTLRIYENRLDHSLTQWAAHCQRLMQSVQELGWVVPDRDRLTAGVQAMQPYAPVLRVTVFPDGRELIIGRSLPADLRDRQRRGVVAWVADSAHYSRPLPQHKTGNYLGCWLAQQAAQRHGAQEAILKNEQGDWLETSTGTLWGWDGDRWWTPPLNAGILPGVVRSRILHGLAALGNPAIEAPWTAATRDRFLTLAYTNSVVEIVPLRAILPTPASVNYNPNNGSVQMLWDAFRGTNR